MKKVLLRAILFLMLLSVHALSVAQSSDTPGNSNNPNGQNSGPGNSDDPDDGSPISGEDGNQGEPNSPHVGNAGGNPQVPIDGGLSVLLVAGAGLGAARMFRKNKEARD